MNSPPVLLLSRSAIARLATTRDYLDAMQAGFADLARGRFEVPQVGHVPGIGGMFHIKSAQRGGAPALAAIKVNGNFPDHRAKHGLPTIQGAILLFDTSTGSPVALLDSIEITIKRTGAATAVAARYLARPESQAATVWGCGAQGRIQLTALRHG